MGNPLVAKAINRYPPLPLSVFPQGEGMELQSRPGLEYLVDEPCGIFTTAKAIPQSLSLSTLVTMEMLKALR